jgi:hypothetical protein
MAKKQNHKRGAAVNPNLTGVQAPAVGMLTPRDIRRSANALVELQTRPQLNAIDSQIRQTQTQGAGIQDRLAQVYANLGSNYTQQLGRYDASNAGSAAQTRAIGDARQNAITTAYGDANQRLAGDATVRGGGLDGGTSAALAAQMGAAHTAAASDVEAASTAQKQTADAYRGLIQTMAAAAPMAGAEAIGKTGAETAKALGNLADKRTDVIGSGDALRVKTMNDLQQQAFTNYATVQGLNLQGDKQAIDLALGSASNDYKYDALNTKIDQNNTTNDQADQRIAQGDERNQIAWGNLHNSQDRLKWQKDRAEYLDSHGGVKGLTPWQRLQFQKGNEAVRSSIESVGAAGDAFHQAMVKGDDGKMHHYTPEQIKAALLKKFGNDADVVNAGIALAHGTLNEGAHPDLIAALKARHIGIPKSWTRTKGYTPAKGA